MENSPEQPGALREIHCAECGVVLTDGQDMEKTADAVFCRPCFDTLQRQLDEVLAAQATDIPYPNALIGGVLGRTIRGSSPDYFKVARARRRAMAAAYFS